MKPTIPALLLFACLVAPAGAKDFPTTLRPPSRQSRGLHLEYLRDPSILWGGEYYVMVRSDFYRRHIPATGFPVSDLQSTLRGRLFLGYGILGGRADLSGAIDTYGAWFRPGSSEGREEQRNTSTGDVGDSRVGLRVAIPTPSTAVVASIEAFLTIPTGNRDKDFSSHETDYGTILGLSLKRPGFRVHLQTGYRLNRNESDGVFLYPLVYPKVRPGDDDTSNDALILRAGVEVSTPGVDLYAEIFADQLIHQRDRVRTTENPVQITPGVRVRMRRGLFLSGSLGFSLARSNPDGIALEGFDYPVEVLYPDWTASLGIHLTSTIGAEDRDDDGIDDPFDDCPDAPEDYDGYLDEDGCPDIDNDRDGILDTWDKAPYDPEDFDGFEDEDGAPDWDNDQDGIPDIEDYCPDDPEDMDGDRDEDGCPEDSGPPVESGN